MSAGRFAQSASRKAVSLAAWSVSCCSRNAMRLWKPVASATRRASGDRRRTLHGREVRSFEELVRALGLEAVASPRRSTVPLVDYWRAPEQRLRCFWESLGVPEPEATEMHFEYEVPVRRGRGKSSYTDLM